MDHQLRWHDLSPNGAVLNERQHWMPSDVPRDRPGFPFEHYSNVFERQEAPNQNYSHAQRMIPGQASMAQRISVDRATLRSPARAPGLGYASPAPSPSPRDRDGGAVWNNPIQPWDSQPYTLGSQPTSHSQPQRATGSVYNDIKSNSVPPFGTGLPANLSTLYRQKTGNEVNYINSSPDITSSRRNAAPQDTAVALPRPVVPPLRPQHPSFQSQGHSRVQSIRGAAHASAAADRHANYFPHSGQTPPLSSRVLNGVSEERKDTDVYADGWRMLFERQYQADDTTLSTTSTQHSKRTESDDDSWRITFQQNNQGGDTTVPTTSTQPSKRSENPFICRPQPLPKSRTNKARFVHVFTQDSSPPGKPHHLSRRDEYFAMKMRATTPSSDYHSTLSSAAKHDAVHNHIQPAVSSQPGQKPITNDEADSRKNLPLASSKIDFLIGKSPDRDDGSILEHSPDSANRQTETLATTPATPTTHAMDFKEPKAKKEFDSDAFDMLLYAETKVLGGKTPHATVLAPSSSRYLTRDARLFFYANPAIQTMHNRPEEWHVSKAEEIKARGGRKTWFGKVAARRRWIDRRRRDDERKRKRAIKAGSIPPRQDPQPRGYSRPMNFADVPETQLPDYVQDNPDWMKACAWLRHNKASRKAHQRKAKR